MNRTKIRNHKKELLGTIEGDKLEDSSIGDIIHEIETTRQLMTTLVELLQQLRTTLYDEVFHHNPDTALKHEIGSFLQQDLEIAKKIAILPHEKFQQDLEIAKKIAILPHEKFQQDG